jgi:hypothetical protein
MTLSVDPENVVPGAPRTARRIPGSPRGNRTLNGIGTKAAQLRRFADDPSLSAVDTLIQALDFGGSKIPYTFLMMDQAKRTSRAS